VPASKAYNIGMRQKQSSAISRKRRRPVGDPSLPRGAVQYTVRGVPTKADQALRRKAEELKVSLNELLRRALLKEAGITGEGGHVYHDLDAFIGSWQEDPEFDAIIAAQDRVDEEMWA
jgi:hypothetical protein